MLLFCFGLVFSFECWSFENSNIKWFTRLKKNARNRHHKDIFLCQSYDHVSMCVSRKFASLVLRSVFNSFLPSLARSHHMLTAKPEACSPITTLNLLCIRNISKQVEKTCGLTKGRNDDRGRLRRSPASKN